MNQHIKTYCKDYITSPMSPLFAVLIKGKWGCGKTHIVKEVLNDEWGDKWQNNAIWLSVYGISNIQQLNTKLYEKMHPVLTHKLTKFGTKLVRTALRLSTAVNIYEDNNTDVTLNINFADLQADVKRLNTRKVFIIDDIERCGIPPHELLGFFSDYIIEKDMRVIFIGNTEVDDENETSNFSKEKRIEFDKIKEKIIGMELHVEPDTKSAIDSFVDELKSSHISEYKDVITEKCLEVMKNLEYKNLRTIRQAFFYLHRVFSILGEERRSKKVIPSFVQNFLVVFIQKTSCEITKEKAFHAINCYISHKKTYKNCPKDADRGNLIPIQYALSEPLAIFIPAIIFNGKFDNSGLIFQYDNYVAVQDSMGTITELMTDFPYMTDDDFRKKYNEMETSFVENKYVLPMDIFNYITNHTWLMGRKVIHETIEELRDRVVDYVNRNAHQIKMIDNFYMYNTIPESEGDIATQAVHSILYKNNEVKKKAKLKKEFDVLYKGLPASLDSLVKKIELNKSDYNYYYYPILEDVDIDLFYKKLKELSILDQMKVFDAFLSRYKQTPANTILHESHRDDIPYIKKLTDLYLQDSQDATMSIVTAKRNELAESYALLHHWMATGEWGNKF